MLSGLVALALPLSASAQTTTGQGDSSAGYGYAAAQGQAPMSADAIIRLLQTQPMLLEAARIRLAQALGVDPTTLTDQALFDRIRQDPALCLRITEELRKRGYDTTGWTSSGGMQPGASTSPMSASSPWAQSPSYSPAQPGAVPLQAGVPAPSDMTPAQPGMMQNQSGMPAQPSPGFPGQPQGQSSSQGQGQSLYPPGYPQVGCPPSGTGTSGTSGCAAPGTMPGMAPPQEAQPQTLQRPVPYPNLPSLEDLYTQMLPPDSSLKRFGSDVFVLGTGNTDTLPTDLPAGADYVLGPGDELNINVWGSQSESFSALIDRQGEIALPVVGAIAIAGRTIAQAQDLIRKTLQTQFQHASVEISLGRVHTVRVYVVGDVQRPGAYDISSLSTPLNALYAAGGPTSDGSLRVLRHYRGATLVGETDLYDLLLRGVRSGADRLLAGDTILVPPVGPQITVTGMVRRPAIYELRDNENLWQVLEMAGGVLTSASLEQIDLERIESHQRRTMLSIRLAGTTQDQPTASAASASAAQHVPVAEPTERRVSLPASSAPVSAAGPVITLDQQAMIKLTRIDARDGDRIVVLPILPYNEQAVYLDGHVFRPGKYPYREGMTINDLLRSYQDVMPEPADHAELIRLAAPDYRPVTTALNLPDVLRGNDPIPLQPFDVVRVFSRYEVDSPTVTITGEVLRPGDYPLEKGMTAAALLNMAGGFRRSAYRDSADLASYTVENGQEAVLQHRTLNLVRVFQGDRTADVLLMPGDVLSVRQITGWADIGSSVTLKGEVGHPGSYAIDDGERLSSVLERAGGLRSTAFPQGAVLERVEVRELGEKARLQLIQKIQSQDLTSMVGSSGTAQEEQQMLATVKQQQQEALSALQNQPASGRLVIDISGDLGKWRNTRNDIELRNGDVLTVPKRSDFVLVSGQVYSPVALTYVSGKNAEWYLRRAGGATSIGDRKKIFVIRADGEVVGRQGKFGDSVLKVRLHPGDAVVVPEKIVGAPLWKNLLSVAQIMSATSLTAALAAGL